VCMWRKECFFVCQQILDPEVRQLNAYGLSKHAVPFAGVAGMSALVPFLKMT